MSKDEERVDVAVVGCGGAGAAAAWWLARRGRRVVAIDRFEPGHRRGSSHGTERIVRAAYADPVYVRMAVDSLRLWRELEAESGVSLLTPTGGIDFGFVEELEDIAANCRDAGVPIEWLGTQDAQRRFPGLRFEGPALYQPETATVHAERAVATMQLGAVARDATIHFGEQVLAIEGDADGVTVRSDRRAVRADVVVVTAGAWAAATIGALAPLPPIAVTQEQIAFFRPLHDGGPGGWPTFIDRDHPTVYGMRTPDGLVKAGEHYTGPEVDPDDRDFALEPDSWHRLLQWVGEHLPGVDPTPITDSTCLYASTPAEDFVIDRVDNVVVGAGFGGHGFKFLPEIGRRLAELADGEVPAGNPFALDSPVRTAGRSGHK